MNTEEKDKSPMQEKPAKKFTTGSRIVYLRAKKVNNHLPEELRASAITKLSSVYVKRQPLRPFDDAKEKKILKGMLDVGPESPEWDRHTRTFWAEFTVNVGFEGVELEIGVDDKGLPLNTDHYIKYHFAVKHPHCALTEAEMLKDQSKRFYIHDEARKDKERNNAIQDSKEADADFIKLARDKDKMRMVYNVLGKMNGDTLTDEQIENLLYEEKNAKPRLFSKVCRDKELELKAEISNMVSAGVIRKIGNQHIYIDKVLGDTLDDTIVYLKDERNSGELLEMRAKFKTIGVR